MSKSKTPTPGAGTFQYAKKPTSPPTPAPEPGMYLVFDNDEQCFEVKSNGAKIFYRRPTPNARRKLLRECLTDDGKNVDYEKFQTAIFDYSVLRWENIYAKNPQTGETVPVTARAYIRDIIDNLDDVSYLEFMKALGIISGDYEKALEKNS